MSFSRKRTFARTTASGAKRIVSEGYGSWSDWGKFTQTIAKRDGKKCSDCGTSKPEAGPYETHHIIPLSRGGTTTKANTRYLCAACHDRRHPHHSIPRGDSRKSGFGSSKASGTSYSKKRLSRKF